MPRSPTIAIVGRPNVGKSTLFNRLTGTRAALVSDVAGLTRDRREGESEIEFRRVRLVDTAGLEEAARGSIADRMRKQTEAAVADADLVLFMVDARAGVTAADEVFARAIRASGRPVVLVANKCEGSAADSGFYDAFKLGFGEPVAISAEHGLGLGDLERDIAAALGIKAGGRGEEAPAETERALRVAIVGRPNTGKSTLINALLGEERMLTGPEPGLTRDAVASDAVWEGRRVRLFDTAGLRRKAKVEEKAEKLAVGDTLRAIRFAEVVVLVVDAEHALEHQDLSIGDLVTKEGRALVIAVNKWDLIADKQSRLREIRAVAAQGLSQVPGVAVIAISARSETGLDKLVKAVLKAAETWNRRVATADLNRWLAEALSRHAPPAASGRRIKIRYATQPSTRPPTFVAFCSKPADLPKSYVKYLTNSLRAVFGLDGVPLRFSLRKGENPYDRGKRR